MKKIFLAATIIFMSMVVRARQVSPAEQLAAHIAQKMKDSLTLTDLQKSQLYSINMQLHERKSLVYQQYTAPDSLRIYLQRVENTRDSLYKEALPLEKFELYLQRKKSLISAN